jgi:hypothetical protein
VLLSRRDVERPGLYLDELRSVRGKVLLSRRDVERPGLYLDELRS